MIDFYKKIEAEQNRLYRVKTSKDKWHFYWIFTKYININID